MRLSELKESQRNSYGRESRGYLKNCRHCGKNIYMLEVKGSGWKPFESWVAGNAYEGEWILHNCGNRTEDSIAEGYGFKQSTFLNKRYCSKCFLILPTSTNTCPNCY